MPLEIRELVIRTTVTSDSTQLGGDSDEDEAVANESAIIAACVDQVLAILHARKER